MQFSARPLNFLPKQRNVYDADVEGYYVLLG